MGNNNFILQLIASLNKTKSKQQIKADTKSLGDLYIKLIGNLDMIKTKKAIKAQLKGLSNSTFNIKPNVNTKGVQSATKSAINNAQVVANNNKVHLNFDTNKQQLVNQIKILGKNNNKLFNNREMTAKYNQLLNAANVAKSTGELKILRGELSAFKTELVATNNAGMTWGSKFKESVKSYTKFFSGASLVYAISNQIRNAATEAKTLDDSLVNLQKVTDEIADRDALYKYFDKSLSKAQELNVKVSSLIDAVTEFKKLGWELDDAELGAKWANILSNVGDVDIDTAIGSIKTSIASFDEIGGYGNDQMDKKLEAYTDLINNMSNKYSIDAEGLAESIRLSAGTLTEAHMSIEQAATMFATANKYYNDPSYLGNTAKIGSLRMRASSGDTDAIEELQEMGEEVDDLATATSNLREKLMALTGVDIMEDEHTFKSYYDQLYEIAQVMDQLDDTSRANVLETMFGKSRSAAGAAILSGMKESASAYEDAINSAGSATEEYQTWMTSADAACQRFSNTLTETYQSIINGNTVRDLANLGSAVLEFANNWGIVEGTLKGVIALNLGKFIATGGMALITATKQVEQYGKALQMASNVPNGNLSARFQALKSIAQATSTLTTEQLRNVLATNTLTQADRVRILQMQGMTKEMALQKLAEMNLTQATNAQTAANTASTASTFSLKAAMTGLGATLKSVFLSNPVGIVLMGISIGVSAVTSAVSKHNQAVEEARQKAKEAADNANTLGDEIAELANKYIQLSDAVKTNASAKDDLMTTQTELLKKLGLEGESIDDLIAKYGSLSNAIKQASIDSLKNQQIDLIAGVDAAREELIKAGKDAFGSNSWKNSIVAMGEEAGKAWQVLEDAGIISSGTHTDVGGEWFLAGDASEQGVLENYKTIEKALEALRDSNKFTQEELSQNDLFKELYNRYNAVKEAAESYDSEIDNLNENLAQQTTLTALQGNELPKTKDDFDKFKQELIDTAVASKQFIGNEKEIADAINNYLSTVPEFEGYYSIPLENELDKVDGLLNQEDFSKTLSEFLSENKKLEKQLIQLSKVGKLDTETIQSLDDYDKLLSLCGNDADSLISKLKKLSDESNTTFDATNNLDTITGGLDSLSEVYSQAMNDGFVDSDALASLYDQFGDLSVFEDFAKAMQNIGEAGYDSAQSFNDLADAYINAKLPLSDLTEATKKQYIAELEKNGVENAEEAITGRLNYITTVRKNAIESLANTQEYANTTTEDLANATFEEITQMINAAEASGADTKALGLLAAAKIQSNANQLNESTTIEQLIDAAQAAGVGAVAIESYNHTKNYLHGQDLENYTKSFKERLLKELNDIKIDFPKYKYNGVSPKTKSDSGKSASDSAKEAQDTSKQYDWIAIAIQRCEEAITSLDRAEGNTYEWWSKRNKALLEEINQTAREIELLQYSYNGYMDAANAVGLSDDYKQKVINGAIQIETVTDENLQKKIDEFQQWWEKARDCKDKIDELNISLSKLAQQKFDNIVSHFEEREKAFTGLNDILDAQVKLAEAKGQIVSRKYYDAMIKNEQSNNKLLVQQRDQMVKSLNEAVSSGKIKQGSETWYDMKAQIDAINKAIIESNTSLQEFQNSIRQLKWDKFDRLIEEIQDVADEIDWVSSLLKDDDLTDGKSNRGLTDKGNAKMGSYASMYNLYMAESQKYASEIKKIDKELAKDPYNQDLIDRKKELIKAQRDVISSAEDEKDAMIDLTRKGYDAILESLQDLIDKKKEALESEKDLYEYQKSIAEKTKNIAALRKQLITYDKDNSEEAKKKVQQIRVDLADAEQDLRDTEYDRWVSDQEEMMDNLYQDYSDKIDEKFENLEVLFQDLLKNVNDNSASISDTLKEAAKDAGYIVSDAFDTIFSGGKIASNFNGKFTTYQTTVQNALAEIVNSVTNMYEIAAKQAGVKVKQTKKAKGSADDKKEDKEQNTVKENLKWVAGKWAYEFVKSASIQTSDGSILTPVDTAQLDLTRGIDASLANISKSPILNMSNVSSNGSAGDVQLVIENIALPNVKDPKEFSEQLLSAMQNDKQVLKTMRAATIDLAVGKNSKRINRF